MDYAQDGNLSKYDPEDIADAMEWEGDAEHLITALIESGFVDDTDEGLQIHDWYDYAGRLIEKRAEDAERKRKARRKAKDDKKDVQKDVHGTSSGHPADGARNLTIPNHTIPNQESSRSSDRAHAREGDLFRLFEENFVIGLNQIQKDRLCSYLDDGMEPELIKKAIEITKLRGKSLDYFWGVLSHWFDAGIKTVESYEYHEARRRRRGVNVQPSRAGPRADSEIDYNALSL